MSYFVFCTFDLKGASWQDYQNAYADLEKVGLKKVVASNDNRNIVIPTTAAAGEFTGASAGAIRDDLRERTRKAFAGRGFSSEIFVVVAGDWAWGAATT